MRGMCGYGVAMTARAFAELTPRGQAVRLRRLVPQVLAAHDVHATSVGLVARAFNTTVRVDDVRGRRFALRIGSPWRMHTAAIAEAEAVWAAALAADTDVAPPQVVRTPDGAPSVWAMADGVPQSRECLLFSWQPGRALRIGDPTEVATAGSVLAALHAHGASFGGVRPDQVLRADRVCYFRLPVVLADRGGALFDEALDWAQRGLDRLWRDHGARAHILHGDFYQRNVLVDRGTVVPIDFQDAAWGLEAQDIAIALVMLDHEDPSGVAAAAFERGYRRRRAWPADPDDLSLLQIARRLHVANFVLNVRPGYPGTFIVDLGRDLRRML